MIWKTREAKENNTKRNQTVVTTVQTEEYTLVKVTLLGYRLMVNQHALTMLISVRFRISQRLRDVTLATVLPSEGRFRGSNPLGGTNDPASSVWVEDKLFERRITGPNAAVM